MKTQRAVRKKTPIAKRVLHRERTLIARIMETSPAGITMVNRKGKVTFANRQAEKVLGLTKDKISQRTYNDQQWHITDYQGNPFPEDKLPFRQIMSTGKPVHHVRHAIERSDGQRVLLSINAAPLFDKFKHVNGMVATLEDVTERVRAEAAVQESEERLHRLSDITVEGIVIHEKGIILDANQALATMFGYELSEIIGQYALNFSRLNPEK